MISTRRIATTLVAACLATGLAAAPAATAADGNGTKANAAQKKKAKGPTTRKLNSDLRKVRTRTTKAERTIRSLDKTLKQLNTLAKSADGKASTLLTAAPQLISGLTQLGDAVTKQIAPGLTALSTAVQTQIAPNLTRLGDAYQSVEYGRAGVFGSSNLTIAAGNAVTSADIPDDGNQISVSENATAVLTGALPATIDLRAAIRSAEEDGDAASKTAGQAGGFVTVKNVTQGTAVACAGTPTPPGIIGTVAGETIQTPTGPVNNLPLKNIPGGLPRTDLTAPTATSTSLLPAACTITGGVSPADIIEIHYSVQFADIPTSTTPGAKE